MNDAERQELEELRTFKKMVELTNSDMANPNVLLIEGELGYYEGEYSATSVKTKAGLIYLAEVVEDLMGWKDIGTFCWHLADKPLGYYQLEDHLIKTVMGITTTRFSHAYSDLTGYLWTNEDIKVGGHDVLKEINDTAHAMLRENPAIKIYLALRVERAEK